MPRRRRIRELEQPVPAVLRKPDAQAAEPDAVMALQRSAGNAAVAQALSVQRAPAPKEPLTGLGAQFAVDQYVGVAQKLQENWARLTPDGRAKVLVNAANFELSHIDVPPVEMAMGDGAHDDGEFDQANWTMTMAKAQFAAESVTDADAASVASNVYHEARHAEQYFLIAR